MTHTTTTLPAVLFSGLLLFQASAFAANGGYQQGVKSMEAGNFAEAYCVWKPLAEQGHIEAQYSVGWMYANGYGLSLDEAEALRWWTLAAKRGHPDAQFAVAMAYVYGEGVKKDTAEAVKWLVKSATNNVDDAQVILRDMAGRGIEEAEQVVRDVLKNNGKILGASRIIGTDRANIRAKPGTDFEILVTLDQGAEVIVLTRKDDWYRIGIVGTEQIGWVYKNLLAAKEKGDE